MEKKYQAAPVEERYGPRFFIIASAFFVDHSMKGGLWQRTL